MSTVLDIVANAYNVAEKAAIIIKNVLKKGELGIVDKGINDLQTEADRSAQRCIMSSLKHRFPNVKMVGEEDLESEDCPEDWLELGLSQDVLQVANRLPNSLQNVTDDRIIIWVDPLDGTNEYTQGLLDHVTVLIGISVDGKAIGGVMCQPYYNYKAGPTAKLGRTIWGIVGVGAFGLPQPTIPPAGRVIATTRSHSSPSVTAAVEACSPREIIRVGGAGHKVILVIEGIANAYVFASPGCKKWDTAAPEAVLRAAGGMLTDIRGDDIPYKIDAPRTNHTGVLATCLAKEHEWYLKQIPESVKNDLKSK